MKKIRDLFIRLYILIFDILYEKNTLMIRQFYLYIYIVFRKYISILNFEKILSNNFGEKVFSSSYIKLNS